MIIKREMGEALADTTMSSPVYLDVTKPPFTLHGLYEPFRRMPKEVSASVSETVKNLAENSTGARVTFKTTSDFIVVHAEVESADLDGNSSVVAATGFDIYFRENGKYVFRGIFNPSQGPGKTYVESRLKYYNNEEKDVVIYFPMRANLKKVYIGLAEGSTLDYGSEYTNKKPIVFYGSSIVHGIALLRPSTVYSSVVARHFDSEFINLGFGGGARAEIPMMEYMADMDMSVFVYDYDHNAQTVQELQDTHYRGYEIIRKKHPTVPIIMASRPDYYLRPFAKERVPEDENEKFRQVIEDSCNRAKAAGDKNVYFIDGRTFYPDDFRDDCSHDGCHPNELGYHYMAKKFIEVMKDLL